MLKLEEILRTAGKAGASDVHLTVDVSPKMRVNGRLITMDYPRLLPSDTLDVLIGIMTEIQRNKFEESGEYEMSISLSGCGRYRVNAYRQRGFVALAFRVVENRIPSPEELGMPAFAAALWQCKRGLIVVTGPAGSGKSTTLAALTDMINENREAHVITLEKPIEYLHQHKKSMVNQREIGIDSNSYADALRAALREDPDVILLGELNDFETASVAVEAAEAGCLVLSAMHAMGVSGAVESLIDMYPPYRQKQVSMQLANVLQAVVAQQLLPTADGEGRVAAFEVMHANQTVRSLIRAGKISLLADRQQTEDGIYVTTMDDAIWQLYHEGRIDRETAVGYAQAPDVMMMKI